MLTAFTKPGKNSSASDLAESFEKDVRDEMFPLFSEFATCAEVADVYHSWTFYNSDAKDFMPDFTSRD